MTGSPESVCALVNMKLVTLFARVPNLHLQVLYL